MLNMNNGEKLRAKLAQGELCIGSCVTFTDPSVSEVIAESGYDFAWIDMEHGAITIETALSHVLALRGTDTAPFIRVPWNDPVLLKPVLDVEPAAIIVPMIRTKADVESAVAACMYPPDGVRGFGPRRGLHYGGQPFDEYLKDANDRIMIIVQIEHMDAVENLDEILAVRGLDGICIGPLDLSGSMGIPGQTRSPEMMKVIDDIIVAACKTDKLVGIATGFDPVTLARWVEKGLHWISLSVDFIHLYSSWRRTLDDARATAVGKRDQ